MAFGRNHARALGFDPTKIVYDESYSSANGDGRQKSIRLAELRIDGVVVGRNISASILNATLSHPLLGASALSKLGHLEYRNGTCTLTLPVNAVADPAAEARREMRRLAEGMR